MTDTGQFDRFGVIASQLPAMTLNRRVEVEDQAADVAIPYHAPPLKKRRHAHTSCEPNDPARVGPLKWGQTENCNRSKLAIGERGSGDLRGQTGDPDVTGHAEADPELSKVS